MLTGGKEEIKLFLFTVDIIVYIKYCKSLEKEIPSTKK